MTSKFLQDINNTLSTFVPGYSAVESLVDNFVRDTVSPVAGSIVYCSLFGVEHSGICIGDGKIVELRGKLSDTSGTICKTDKAGFTSGTNALTVYVACRGNGAEVIGNEETARRALEYVGEHIGYNLFTNNCHMFTSSCITGNTKNIDNFFVDLQNTIRHVYGNFNWRAWD